MSVVSRGSSKWSIALTALGGAWTGHFVEYVRVYGWHAAIAEMSSPAHAYFLPAGAALMGLVVVAAVFAGRAWRLLGRRLQAAQVGLWKRPRSGVGHGLLEGTRRSSGTPSLVNLWTVLLILQIGTWVIQENLESIAAGGHVPLLSVMSGVHALAPLIQAEFALIFGVVYWLVNRQLADRRSRVCRLELLVARRWTAGQGLLPAAINGAGIPSTPLERWGAQRWQRPPPGLSLAI